jgi:hypothetical protein
MAWEKEIIRIMKIFGIGVARTGTTTLAKALEILGYKSVHVECNVMEVSNDDGHDTFSINKEVIENNEAIVGTPLSPCYEMLANQYPDSLFIITIRESEGWLKSCSLSFTEQLPMDDNHHALHRWLYDSILFDKEKFLKGYMNYVNKVLTFFDRNNRKLFLYNICSGNRWLPLCEFVGKDVPECPFPHESKRGALLK